MIAENKDQRRAAPIAAQLDQTTERERVCRENAEFTDWWNRVQACPEHNLITENAAHAAWQERACRATPAAAQLDANALPPLTRAQIWEIAKTTIPNIVISAIEHFARAIETKVRVPYAERIRHLERELAELRVRKDVQEVVDGVEALKQRVRGYQNQAQSIDTGEFRELLQEYWRCMGARSANEVTAKIIAYIDGRTAGTSPAWQPIETAPKDGSAVLLTRLDAGGAWIGKYDPVYQSGYRPDNPWFSLMLNRDYLPKPVKSSVPTHWMPLPAAPSLSGTEEGK